MRKHLEVDEIFFRRSPIMNMIVSSYRFGRVLRTQAIFKQAVKRLMTTKREVVRFIEDKDGNSRMEVVERDISSAISSQHSTLSA